MLLFSDGTAQKGDDMAQIVEGRNRLIHYRVGQILNQEYVEKKEKQKKYIRYTRTYIHWVSIRLDFYHK